MPDKGYRLYVIGIERRNRLLFSEVREGFTGEMGFVRDLKEQLGFRRAGSRREDWTANVP